MLSLRLFSPKRPLFPARGPHPALWEAVPLSEREGEADSWQLRLSPECCTSEHGGEPDSWLQLTVVAITESLNWGTHWVSASSAVQWAAPTFPQQHLGHSLGQLSQKPWPPHWPPALGNPRTAAGSGRSRSPWVVACAPWPPKHPAPWLWFPDHKVRGQA